MKDDTTNQSETGLKPKQERFCREYLRDFNATAAAKRAGYHDKGAQSTGSRILALPAAQQFLRHEQDRINAKMDLATDAVNNELLDIAYLERGEFLDDEGDLKNLKDLPEHLRAAVQVSTKKIKSDGRVSTVTTYSLFNKIQMMEKISKRQAQRSKEVEPNSTPVSNTANLGDGTIVEI